MLDTNEAVNLSNHYSADFFEEPKEGHSRADATLKTVSIDPEKSDLVIHIFSWSVK